MRKSVKFTLTFRHFTPIKICNKIVEHGFDHPPPPPLNNVKKNADLVEDGTPYCILVFLLDCTFFFIFIRGMHSTALITECKCILLKCKTLHRTAVYCSRNARESSTQLLLQLLHTSQPMLLHTTRKTMQHVSCELWGHVMEIVCVMNSVTIQSSVSSVSRICE